MKFKKKMMMAWQSQRKYGALSSLGERRVIWKEETSFRGLIVKGKQEEISEFQWPQKLRVSSNQKHAPGDAAHTYHSSKSLSSTVPTEEGTLELGDAVSQPLSLGSHKSRVWDQGLYASQVITGTEVRDEQRVKGRRENQALSCWLLP